jgi:PST family polysaccharide transporter
MKIIKNTKWLLSEKGIKIIFGFFVAAWMARYLGPENMGYLSFATAITAVLSTVVGLGLQNIMVKNLVENEKNEKNKNEIIGTSLLLVTISSFFIYTLNVSAVFMLNIYPSESKVLLLIISSTVLFKQSEILQYIYESKIESKNVALLQIFAYIFISLLRIISILLELSLKWFALIIVAEVIIVCIGMILQTIRGKLISPQIRVSTACAKKLIKHSFPLLIASLSSIIYMKIDQIMLGLMVSSEELGLFSVATRLSELMYILPMALMASFYPLMVSVKNNEDEYRFLTLSLFKVLILISILICITLSVFSNSIISIVYGGEYTASEEIFNLHIWTLVFVTIGVISHSWYINQNSYKIIVIMTLVGAALNILLNSILIPKYNGYGAALASLISQFFVSVLGDLFGKDTRKLFLIKINSLNPSGLKKSFKALIK